MTAKTSSTVRPDAAMRARSAALISRIAAFRSAGGVSQCGSVGRAGVSRVEADVIVSSFGEDSLLEVTVGALAPSGKSPY